MKREDELQGIIDFQTEEIKELKAALKAVEARWKCNIISLHHPQRHFQEGLIRTIKYKDKTITVCNLDD